MLGDRESLGVRRPVASLAVVCLIVPRALLPLRDSVNLLMESTPRGLSRPAVRQRILRVPGVEAVHDLQAQQIRASLPMLTAYVVAAEDSDVSWVLHQIDRCLAGDFHFEHSTIQVGHTARAMESDAHA